MTGEALLDAWVAALESGEYKQEQGCLKRAPEGENPSYCCLGVLWEIAGGEWKKPELGFRYLAVGKDDFRSENYLPESPFPGMDCDGKIYRAGTDSLEDPIADLADLNDQGIEFTDIAQKIKALHRDILGEPAA